jgi:hypothetical protein
MNQQDFDFDLETPRHKTVWSSLKTGFNNTCTWAMENPGELILFAVGVMMLDIDNTLETIEEYEEIQTAIDVYEFNGGA